MPDHVEQLKSELSRVRSLNKLLEARVAELEQQLQERGDSSAPKAKKSPPLTARSERSLGGKSTDHGELSDRPTWDKSTVTEAEAAARKSRATQNVAHYIPEAPRPPTKRRPCTAPPDSHLRPTAATMAKNVRAQRKRDPLVRSEPVDPVVRAFGSSSPRKIDYRTSTPGVGHYEVATALNPRSLVAKSFGNQPRFAADSYRPADELRFARTP
jgi:hypothetical protein